jgi:AcrR family transcriptional regulator
MDNTNTLSTEQVAAHLGVSRETVNQYAQTLEAARDQSLKVRGGARRFGPDELGVFRRMQQRLRETSGIGLEAACRSALTSKLENNPEHSSGELPARLIETLEVLNAKLEALIAEASDFSEARGRLEQTIDDCGTEIMGIGARTHDWMRQLARLEQSVRSVTELERSTQARLVEIRGTLDQVVTRTLERAATIWIACGVGAFVLGFVILPWLLALLRR